MYKKVFPPNKIITIDEMKQAIKMSGYLIEQRAERIFKEAGYYVETNPVYLDAESGKSREFDIRAISARSINREERDFIFPVIICECINNAQPIVFFVKESPIAFLYGYEVKVSGIPVKFWRKDGYINFSDFIGLEKFHHYCKGKFSTQYCSFKKVKNRSEWIACHDDEHHNTLDSLIKALEHEISEHYDKLVIPDEPDEERINIQIYYPLIILEGELYEAELKNKDIELRKVNHIQFRKEVYSRSINERETYQIDIITEDYLQGFLEVIEWEIDKIKRKFQRNRSQVNKSMIKIIQEVKKRSRKERSLRKLWEF